MASPSRLLKRSALIFVAVASLLSWQLAAAAPIRHSPPAIKLGGVFGVDSPVSSVASSILGGYQLAFTQANHTGGIKGASIDYLTQDDQYNSATTVQALKTLVESDGVLAIAGVFGSPDSAAAVPYLEGKRVPFFDPIGGGVDVSGDPWVWQTEPSYALEGTVIANYLKKVLKINKVAALYQADINKPQITALSKAYGSKFLSEPYDANDTTFVSQLSQIQSFDPQIVVLLGTPLPLADFLGEAAGNGYQPPKGWFANYPEGDPTFVELAQPRCTCLQGSHVSSYADLTGHNPVAKAYAAAIRKYDPSQANTNYGLYGYFNGSLMVRALKLAAPNPTAAKLQKIFNTKFRNYKSGFTGVLNWTPKNRYGVKQFKIYKIQVNGPKFIPITGWLNN